jgi:uncharacterized damage-inducible protein DinB
MEDVREGRYPTDVDGFLHVIADARSTLERAIEGRSERELTELRDAAGWSVKDHLYHLAAWERGMIYLLQKRPRDEGMGIDERSFIELDADAINAIIFEQHKDLPLSEVLETFDAVHRDMVSLLSTMSWSDLARAYSYYAPDEPGETRDQPVLYWVFGNTAGHFEEHCAWIEEILAQGSDTRGE